LGAGTQSSFFWSNPRPFPLVDDVEQWLREAESECRGAAGTGEQIHPDRFRRLRLRTGNLSGGDGVLGSVPPTMRRVILLIAATAALAAACGDDDAATVSSVGTPPSTSPTSVVPATTAPEPASTSTGGLGSTTATTVPETTTIPPTVTTTAATATTSSPPPDADLPAAPDFALALGEGGEFTLSEAAAPVFLVFWAEW
jgi:hypothetical protein